MDSVLRVLPFVYVYLDDILIASATEEEHLSHLRALFTRLSQHGLIVNPAKCLFGRGTIEFLGHRVTCEGAVPLPSKVEAVAAFPRPLTARSLREFIGMVTFYHRFIPRAAHTLRPLYEALKGKSPNQAIEWTAEREGAFKDTKAALAQAAMLAHPSHTAPIAITTDASDYAVGAVYEQWVGGAWQPLAFFSRQLSPSERKYSTFDRELLGLWLAIRHFRFYWRAQRQFSFISEFTTDIQHVAGKSNLVADCLSRAVVGAVQLGLDYSHMAMDQASDPTVQTLKTMDTGLRLEEDDPLAGGSPLSSTTSADLARAFIGTWVVRFGTPSDLSSDRGPQFTSELWSAVAEGLGVKLHRTTAYHPQANGLCERFHRSMKAALRASLKDGNWLDKLPWVMLGLRTAPKEDLQSSSAELVYGQPLRVPGEFMPNTADPWSAAVQRASLLDSARVFAPVPTTQHGVPTSQVPPGLRSAGYVFIRHDAHRGPLQPPYDGPFRVLEHGPKHLVVDIGGRPEHVSVDRVKLAHLDVTQPVDLATPSPGPPRASLHPAEAFDLGRTVSSHYPRHCCPRPPSWRRSVLPGVPPAPPPMVRSRLDGSSALIAMLTLCIKANSGGAHVVNTNGERIRPGTMGIVKHLKITAKVSHKD
ncbi:hypothetical protein AAFF_G00376790 [Aldrovandia affinis]|uniref:ribonuclease H n=1 Tax=Aldrovandia affinis TaxID=143900 RepID=A0AAD7SFV0_9TELE|nr:hypothetical protein AAFF_G00376790 [Aldrovandia affinis]